MPYSQYTPIEVFQQLEEVVNPDFSQERLRKTKYRSLLQKVQNHPNRWFVVARFPVIPRGADDYGYMKPYLLQSRLTKRYRREGFVFKTFTEDEQTRAVLVQYKDNRNRRITKIKTAKEARTK